MKKVKKGVLFYLGILFGLLLAAFVICVLVMVFSPGTSIFGLRYYNESIDGSYFNMEIYEKVETEDGDTYKYIEQKPIGKNYPISTIKVNTNAHNITIVKANEGDSNYTSFLANVSNKTTGFIAKDYFPSEMSVNYYIDSQTLEFFAEIPVGFLTTGNSSSIYIQIPEWFNTSNLNLVIENQQGGRNSGSVVIGDSKSSGNLEPNLLQFKSASIKTTNGLIISDFAKIGTTLSCGDVVLDVQGGITVDSQIIANNLKIISENGKDKYSNENGLAFKAFNKISIETKSIDANYGTIEAKEIVLKNTYGTQNFTTVSSGAFNISQDSKSCDYNFEKLEIDNGKGTLVVGQEKTEELEEKKADKCNIKVENLIGVRSCLTTGTVEVHNQEFETQSLTIKLNEVDEKTKTATIKFNDKVYELRQVEGDGETTYSIVLDDQNKIIKTTSLFVGQIDGLEFAVLADEKWLIAIGVA